MAEMHFKRTGETLTVTFAEHQAVVPWAEVALNEQTAQRIYDDAATYGRKLFEQVTQDVGLRSALLALPLNERLAFHIEDSDVATIPWEYLRGPDDMLLAARLNMVRYVEGQQRPLPDTIQSLSIVAVPVSPVDEVHSLDTEQEWRRLTEAVLAPQKALSLLRVRPPTLAQLEQTLPGEGTSIVHFMGHSGIVQGKSILEFEDPRGRSQPIDAAYFADALDEHVFLVVLNSCLSAVAMPTEFGNIARTVVRQGVPYALGMQFVLLDDAALEISKTLYQHLLQGRSVEEAVRRVRRAVEQNTTLHHPQWIAGIPVLYTHLREPAPAIRLVTGKPTISPDPAQLQATCDLTALPQALHFVGRGQEISAALEILLKPSAHGFVLLHGLGGIGKTALAYAIAERASWSYRDRVLAISFETFATQEGEKPLLVSTTFADRFYNRLARFYGLDPSKYQEARDLQDAILQQRVHLRSLLVLDNMETLIEAQKQGDPIARTVASFLSRLQEGEGVLLLTSRSVPPSDWGTCISIPIAGLSEEASAEMFLALLPDDRRSLAADGNARQLLARRVQGHPLSIRLLAGRFAEATSDLTTFLNQIEEELKRAEQTTPSSLEDPERQRTLYACMDYSITRLTSEQKQVLHACSLFLAQFLPAFVSLLFEDETEQISILLQQIVRLGLLERKTRTFPEGSAELLEMHPMLRWYIHNRFSEVPAEWRQRYGKIYEQLARQVWQWEGGYDQSAWMRFLIRQSLPDCEAALEYLASTKKSSLAYHLAHPYERMGQNRRALALYELALELDKGVGDIRSIAVTQNAMADVLRQQGKPQEALTLYQESLQTSKELGDVREVAVTQNRMADLLVQQGKPQEALALYEQSLHTFNELGAIRDVATAQLMMSKLLRYMGRIEETQELLRQALQTYQDLGDLRGVGGTQHEMAHVLVQQGKLHEALALYEQSLCIDQKLGDVLGVAITQQSMAHVLVQQDKPHEALALYEQSLRTYQELEDVRGVAMTRDAMATVLREQGKPQEALALYEQSLHIRQELGDVRGVALTQANYSRLLLQQGEYHRALTVAWQAYISLRQHGFSYDALGMQQLLISIKKHTLEPSLFDDLWKQAIDEPQPDWLRDIEVGASEEQGILAPETLNAVISSTITVMTVIQEKRDEWQGLMIKHLRQAQSQNQVKDAEFFTAILAILDGQPPSLPEDHPYANALATIRAGSEVMQAVRDFVNAEDWNASRQVVEEQQSLLFQPEVETIFEKNIAHAKSSGNQSRVQMLEKHLALLRACKQIGIVEAFEQLEEQQR